MTARDTLPAMTYDQLQADVAYLAARTRQGGRFTFNAAGRDYGVSSNSIVLLVYGQDDVQEMPFDWSDYAACVRAVRKMPWHRRRTAFGLLWKARAAVRYAAAERRAHWHANRGSDAA